MTFQDQVFEAVAAVAATRGWQVEMKADGRHLYDKLLSLSRADGNSRIYIDRGMGVSESGGAHSFRVYVHPERYADGLAEVRDDVKGVLNQKTGVNRFSHSGFQTFPTFEGNRERSGKAYSADGFTALDWLLWQLSRSAPVV